MVLIMRGCLTILTPFRQQRKLDRTVLMCLHQIHRFQTARDAENFVSRERNTETMHIPNREEFLLADP